MPIKAGRHSDSPKQGTQEDEPRRPNSPFRAADVIVGTDSQRFLDAFVLVLFSLPHSRMSCLLERRALVGPALFCSHICFGSDHLIAVLAASSPSLKGQGGEISYYEWLIGPNASPSVTAAVDLYLMWRSKPRSQLYYYYSTISCAVKRAIKAVMIWVRSGFLWGDFLRYRCRTFQVPATF